MDPLAADFHVGLVDAPRRTYRPRELVPATLELRNIMMHPTHNGGVGHRQAALGHHLHQIPEAELEAQVPPHAQDDDLAIKVPTIKQLVHAREPRHRTALNSSVAGTVRRPAICTCTSDSAWSGLVVAWLG